VYVVAPTLNARPLCWAEGTAGWSAGFCAERDQGRSSSETSGPANRYASGCRDPSWEMVSTSDFGLRGTRVCLTQGAVALKEACSVGRWGDAATAMLSATRRTAAIPASAPRFHIRPRIAKTLCRHGPAQHPQDAVTRDRGVGGICDRCGPYGCVIRLIARPVADLRSG